MALEIVVGPMFSGKSSYALSYIRRQHAIGKHVLVIKPDIDNRYSSSEVLVTHDQDQTPCVMWDVAQPLNPSLHLILGSDCIVLEESQFFLGLKSFVIHTLKTHKMDILIVGLDADANQEPFGEVLDCIPWATKVRKLCAFCKYCRDGTLAPFTKKIFSRTNQQVEVGSSDKYVAVCLKHLTDTQ